jgi:hypothetical protein
MERITNIFFDLCLRLPILILLLLVVQFSSSSFPLSVVLLEVTFVEFLEEPLQFLEIAVVDDCVRFK